MLEHQFAKILKRISPLSASDLTPIEKRDLNHLMIENGATAGFTYDRFFQKGFAQWEIEGIENIKRDFLKLHEKDLLEAGAGDGNKGYAFALDKSKGGFWRAISQADGMRQIFKEYMRERGMNADATIIKRFTNDDWKRYELRGIDSIIKEFVDNEQISKGQTLEMAEV